MDKFKKTGRIIGLMLFILSVVLAYEGWKGFSAIRPADGYEDRGIHTFLPYRVLPTQVENTSSSRRSRQRNPTKTVYVVYYRATDGTGYRWRTQASSKTSGQKIVKDKAPVERRVLAIRGAKKYISVEAEQTAESYTSGLKRRYGWMFGISAAYIAAYLAAWGIILLKGRRKDEWSTLHFDHAPTWVKKKS